MELPPIIVTFTRRSALQEDLLRSYGLSPEYHEMLDDEHYWQILRNLWLQRRTFVLIEHDVLPWPGAIEELCACPGFYCSNTYRINGGLGIHHAFGCTKISAAFIDLLPDVWDQMGSRHWSKLDAQLCHAALQIGHVPHPHRPPVIHLPREDRDNTMLIACADCGISLPAAWSTSDDKFYRCVACEVKRLPPSDAEFCGKMARQISRL